MFFPQMSYIPPETWVRRDIEVTKFGVCMLVVKYPLLTCSSLIGVMIIKAFNPCLSPVLLLL